jgi:hypothetical protein
MQPFEGFLESVHRSDNTVVARFVVGGIDPEPQFPPVLLVAVSGPLDPDVTYAELCRLREIDVGAYVSVLSETEVHIVTDHGNELTLSGVSISTTEASYEASDFERLAKQNHSWGQSQHRALTQHIAYLTEVRQMLQDQQARTSVKLQSHLAGSTARTLYEQQLSFISRVLAKSGV